MKLNFDEATVYFSRLIESVNDNAALYFWRLMSKSKIYFVGNPEKCEVERCEFYVPNTESFFEDKDFVDIIRTSEGNREGYVSTFRYLEDKRIETIDELDPELLSEKEDNLLTDDETSANGIRYAILVSFIILLVWGILLLFTYDSDEAKAWGVIILLVSIIIIPIQISVIGKKDKDDEVSSL